MDLDAQRRARQRAIKMDLAEAFSDEEACPPEWVELRMEVSDGVAELRQRLASAVETFMSDPDIRAALARRERTAEWARQRVSELNPLIRRMNLLVPLPRFQRIALDADELVRPLYRCRRAAARPG